jgi:hypothetical protein
MEWAGGSPRVARDWFPKVYVERRAGLAWRVEAREGVGEVLLVNESGSIWSARWQPTRYTPLGTYRIRIEGVRQGEDGVATDYELVSKEFTVRPCSCILAGQVHARWHRRHGKRRAGYRLKVAGRYVPGPSAGFRLLPVWVTTGRAEVRVFRDGKPVGLAWLRYKPAIRTLRRHVKVKNLDGRTLPVTTREPVDRGAFTGVWHGRRGARNSVVFKLVSLRDRSGNR